MNASKGNFDVYVPRNSCEGLAFRRCSKDSKLMGDVIRSVIRSERNGL